MTSNTRLLGDDVRALYPTCKRIAFVSDSFAWVQKLDGTIHTVMRDHDGTLIRRARPDLLNFDQAVQLHLEALDTSSEPESELEECEYCGAQDEHEWCGDCDKCEEYCDCPTFDPHEEYGTY